MWWHIHRILKIIIIIIIYLSSYMGQYISINKLVGPTYIFKKVGKIR
jgi:hypothetical protein